jgi:hypothetical protein
MYANKTKRLHKRDQIISLYIFMTQITFYCTHLHLLKHVK